MAIRRPLFGSRRATDFLNGQLTEIDMTSPGDLQLVNTGGESRIIAETGTLDIDHEWVTVQLQNQLSIR